LHAAALSQQTSALIPDARANQMSLFYAYATPFLKSLIDASQRLVESVSNLLQIILGSFNHQKRYIVSDVLHPFRS
jgi:hypothetical protein